MLRSTSRIVLAAALLAGSSAAQTLISSYLAMGFDDAEITPDGRYIVARENTADTSVRIYDTHTGQLLFTQMCTVGGTFSGAAQDAIAVTNTRAILIGSRAMVLDLTNLANPVLAEHLIGETPRDVDITPDGTLAVIRGGSTIPGYTGGLFVIDMATGAMLASHAGEHGDDFPTTYTYDVDSVVVSNDFAACTSIIDPSGTPKTRVAIWRLHPAGGGAPQVVFETAATGTLDQLGAPHDIAISPDGQHVAVRSEFEVGLYSLGGATPTRAWVHGLFGNPGAMGLFSMDSIEMTNSRIVTLGRFSNGALGSQLDMFDVAGNQWYSLLRGKPHDLTVTPSGARAIARTSKGVYLFDLVAVPATTQFVPLAKDETLTSTSEYYLDGLDSITSTNERALVVARNNTQSTVVFYDIRNDTLQNVAQNVLPDRTQDVDISPDEHWAAVTGTSYVQVYDFTTGALTFQHDPINDQGWWPWCDGIAIDNDHLAAFGTYMGQYGWIDIIDLFEEPVTYCTAAINSTGVGSTIHATGSASIARNNLGVVAVDLPINSAGFFVYAAQQTSIPFGGGFLCVSGQRYKMPLHFATNGTAVQAANYNGSNGFGGAITAGTSWNFQYRYRDPGVGGQINFSDALAITFVP